MPSPSVPACLRAGARAGSRTAAANALISAYPQALLDIGHDPLLAVEELLGDRAPAAKVVDREQLRRRREIELRGHGLVHGPVALLAEDLLRRGREEEVDERLRLRG